MAADGVIGKCALRGACKAKSKHKSLLTGSTDSGNSAFRWHSYQRLSKTPRVGLYYRYMTLEMWLCLQERMMPGVIMATECKAFDKLYQLAELEEPRLVGMFV